MAQLPIRPITTKQRIMGAVVLFKFENSERRIKLGAFGTVEITPNVTQVPSYTSEFGDRRLIGNFVTEKTGEVNLNEGSMWHETAYQALFMANKTYRTQSAAEDQTLELEDIEVGYVTRLPGIRASNVAITCTLPAVGEDPPEVIEFEEDVHFTHHTKTGIIEIIAIPEDALTTVTVSYDLPAVTASDKLLDLSIMSTAGVRGQLEIIGVISGGPGKEVEVILPDVEFIPQNAISMGNTEGLNTWSLKGSMYSTSAQGYGFMRSLETV